jgi:hypothetical protein
MIRPLMAKTAPVETREAPEVRAARGACSCRRGKRCERCEAAALVAGQRRDAAERAYRARVAESQAKAAALLREEQRPHVCGACVHCGQPAAACTCGAGRFVACSCAEQS